MSNFIVKNVKMYIKKEKRQIDNLMHTSQEVRKENVLRTKRKSKAKIG